MFAQEFTLYRLALDSRSLGRALQEARVTLRTLRPRQTALRNQLEAKIQQLQTLEALQTSNASVVGASVSATKVAPRPIRNALLALIIGAAAGVGLAFLLEALDTRVRSVEMVSDELEVALLARVPAAPARIQKAFKPVVAVDPSAPAAEAFTALRTSLEFLARQRRASALLFTSAVTGEGKTTTVANLATLFARGGRDVIAVDFDLHRPALGKFFEIERSPGVTDLLFGESTFEEALHRVPGLGMPVSRSNVRTGTLTVLPAGSALPPDLRLFEARHLGELFTELRGRADLLLIDSAPLLRVSDTLDLCAHVDVTVLIARLQYLRRATLRELKRVLAKCPAPLIGFVESDAEHKRAYGYGYGYADTAGDGNGRFGATKDDAGDEAPLDAPPPSRLP